MRLWHKDLIPYLPQKQLVAQWRELCCIAKNIATFGTPNHILVNPILNYPVGHFTHYGRLVIDEMEKRGYNVSKNSLSNFLDNSLIGYDKDVFNKKGFGLLYEGWMNDRYLTQCYYNLQEKYDRGGIPKAEWQKVVNKYYDIMEGKKYEVRTDY